MKTVNSTYTRREDEIATALSRLTLVATPDPEAKARAKGRLMLMFAAQQAEGIEQHAAHSPIAS